MDIIQPVKRAIRKTVDHNAVVAEHWQAMAEELAAKLSHEYHGCPKPSTLSSFEAMKGGE